MWKTVIAGTTVLAIAGASFAFADQGPRQSDHARHWHHHRQMSMADIAAFSDARIAALHAGLELNADQEKNWPVVENALHALAKQRIDRMQARRAAHNAVQSATDPVERLSRRAGALEARGAALKKLADAAGPLYRSLDQAQKHRFAVLARLERMRIGHWRMHHGWRGHDGWRHDGGRHGPERGAQPSQL